MQTPRRNAVILVLLAAVAAGCGGGGGESSATPRLPAQVADALAERSDVVARRLESGDACGARAEAEALQSDTIAAVNAGRIPARYQEDLVSSVAVLVDSIECVPPPRADDSTNKRKDKQGKDDHDEDGEEDD